MNRLQKKCVLATAGVHLLLLVILLVGPAFFAPRPKADDLQVLDVIPANLIDAPFTSGVRNAQPPRRARGNPPPTTAGRLATSPSSRPSRPTLTERPETGVQARTASNRRRRRKDPTSTKLKSTLKLVTRNAPQKRPDNPRQLAASAGLAQRHPEFEKQFLTEHDGGHARQQQRGLCELCHRPSRVFTTRPGTGPAGRRSPTTTPTSKLRVTIASDGTVISARIIAPSGDAELDASVQQNA